MNENELKHALRDTMAAVVTPPPMSETPVLEAARRAQRRRRAGWAGVSSAVAVVAIAVGLVIVAPATGDGGPGLDIGGAETTGAELTESAPTSAAADTEPSWPNGQTDATATSGPHYEKGVTLLGELVDAVPAGVETPEGLHYEDPGYLGGLLRWHQAQYSETVNGVEVWHYSVAIPVTKGNGLGELDVLVITPSGSPVGAGCALTADWQNQGTCQDVPVDGGVVGVLTGAQPDLVTAVYGHEDGTVVVVTQIKAYGGSGKPAMTEFALTDEQLTRLAADPRFNLD